MHILSLVFTCSLLKNGGARDGRVVKEWNKKGR